MSGSPAERADSPPYRAPIEDILLALDTVGLDSLLALDAYAHLDRSVIDTALSEFGRFAAEVVAPIDRSGDLVGSRLDANGAVTTPPGFQHAYRLFAEGGWGGLQFPVEFGGAGLPAVVGLAVQEMLASANLSLSLNPVLTQSGIELLLAWGSDLQRTTYLPKLLSGEWTSTMNLTEPDAGSDLSAVQTSAEPASDGTWRVSGTKVFITWGEHDLAENIVHFVLARTPGAPEGTHGLSLFLVPKFLLDAQGKPAEANRVRCQRLEHKLGIHASPTCVMGFDGAVGELVASEHEGLQAMFTMMNVARIAIGIQGPAVAERAYQQALEYAAQRRQGRRSGGPGSRPTPIIERPDVRRMLLSMRTLTQAGRLLCYEASAQRALSQHATDVESRAWSDALSQFLTPIAKAWAADIGFEAASLGVQVLGGLGFVEESGMPQRLRDSRIAMIYEGTNGIQAIDLVSRKIGRDNGATVARIQDELADFVTGGLKNHPELAETFEALEEATAVFASATRWIEGHDPSSDEALAGATAYLELAGICLGGGLMARRALVADERGLNDAERATSEANFFASEVVGRSSGLLRPVTAGAARLDALGGVAPT